MVTKFLSVGFIETVSIFVVGQSTDRSLTYGSF